MAGCTRHISIQKGQTFPQLQRCTKCCNNFHCPFCMTSVFKPSRLDKLKLHMKIHSKKAVVHGDFHFHRCGLGCRPSLHFHCIYCSTTIIRKSDFKNHLLVCKHKLHSESATKTVSSSSTAVTAPLIINTQSIINTTGTVPKIINTPSIINTTGTVPTIINTPSIISTTGTVPAFMYTLSTTSTDVTALGIKDGPSTTSTDVTTLGIKDGPSTTTIDVTALGIKDGSSPTRTGKIRVRPVIKKRCPMCSILINKTNLQKHIERKHSDQSELDTGDTFQLTSECIDETNGIFTVLKIVKGHSAPLHVQYKTMGENHRILCESNECQINIDIAQRSGIPSYQCVHISAANFCKSSAEPVSLKEEVLTAIVRGKLFSEKKKKECLVLQQLANSSRVPLSVHTSIGASKTKMFISVFEPSVSSYSRLGRVMVVYNTHLNTWHCPCTKVRRSCLHKYVAKWHLFQTHRELLSTDGSPHNIPHSEEEGVTDDIHVYPPKGLGLEYMVNYILQIKRIPAVLPEDMRIPSARKDYPRNLCPNETLCQGCPGEVPLSDPMLITQNAKILTNWCIIEDVATYCKQCPQCGMFYRYQEWKDCLHNFNDHIILDIPLCLTFRSLLQVHTSVSRAVEYLQLMTGVDFPPPDTMLHAYLQFEALTDHEYKYSCPSCGDHPPVVILGVHKPSTSHLSENYIKEPPENFKGEVNLEKFWEALSKEMICRGLVENGGHNPFVVPTNYHFWAPWIGKNTRQSDTVLNTEFEKVRTSKSASEVLEMTVTEDSLSEELFKQKDDVVRGLCNECGVDSTGSRSDILLRLAGEMKSRQTCEKIYSKIWSCSGSWAVIMCPCGIVYSLKCNLQAASPRDFADLLLSWKHMPNIMIYDLAQSLATHTNLRAPEKLPISPFEGLLLEPTQAHIELAKRGQLRVSLPWLGEKMEMTDPHGHPATGSSDHYVLHESNSEDGKDVLRKLTLVPQLAGKVNSEVAERLFAKMKKNNYFMSLSSAHLFLMRNIVHHYNENKANKASTRLRKSSGSNLLTDAYGQAVLENPGGSRSTDNVIEDSILPSMMDLSSA
ncbi:uncharacterized protein LOC143729292 [Siphateles boraxobius]|uniref:uncharacterized protein LOC143729292 n=1 Tax=Siphateles boraxobius TaxID=180520 RepID=UPI004063DD59